MSKASVLQGLRNSGVRTGPLKIFGSHHFGSREYPTCPIVEDWWFPGPRKYAVRSSCEDEDGVDVSFAGIHETILNVSYDALGDAMQRVYYSAYSQRAMDYRNDHGLSVKPSMGVIVQPMVDVKRSFVYFSKHPLSKDGKGLMQTIKGPCELLVSGEATGAVWDSNIPGHIENMGYASATFSRYAEIALDITKSYEKGVDIEGGWDEHGRLYLFQARPITF